MTTAKAMASSCENMTSIDGDGGGGSSDLRHYCTLRNNRANSNGVANGRQPEDDRRAASRESDAARVGQLCTIRGSKGTTAMGNTAGVGADPGGAIYFGEGGENERSEFNRNLLYEENMCTFENFCEKSLEDRGGEEGEAGSEGIENFCTLRKKRSVSQKAVDQVNDGAGYGPSCDGGSSDVRETSLVEGEVASYCTLKKKKLKLNQKFVENFLEDPNAKLHDYLSELDAYLDEIDGLDSEGQFSSDDEEEEVPCEKVKEEIVPENDHAEAAPPPAISYIDVKNFCTLPKRKRVQFLNAFQRAGPLRRTFAAPGPSSRRSSNKENSGNLDPIRGEVIAEADESSPAGTADRDSVGAAKGK